MGFLDDLGERTGKAAREKLNEVKRLQKELDMATDNQLLSEVKHSSGSKKIAIINELKYRGYSREDLDM